MSYISTQSLFKNIRTLISTVNYLAYTFFVSDLSLRFQNQPDSKFKLAGFELFNHFVY